MFRAVRQVSYGQVNERHKVPGSKFLVDAFTVRCQETASWFLTHFHSDHYMGLDRNFNNGMIYCTPITSSLCIAKLQIPRKVLRDLEINVGEVIEDVLVTALDANHCPGSAMLLFQHRDGTAILHCGDMRWHSKMMAIPALAPPLQIDYLYLDTTYCDSKHRFPMQEVVIDRIVEYLRPHVQDESVLFCIGTYSIGKERVLLRLAEEFRCRIRVSPQRLQDLRVCGLPEHIFTTDARASRFHVIPLGDISYQALDSLRQRMKGQGSRFSKLIAIRPTGWSHSQKRAITVTRHEDVTFVSVAYSEHSSYTELKECVAYLRPVQIVPTVNAKSKEDKARILNHFNEYMDTSKDRSKISSYFPKVAPPLGRSSVPAMRPMRCRTVPAFPTAHRFSSGMSGPARGTLQSFFCKAVHGESLFDLSSVDIDEQIRIEKSLKKRRRDEDEVENDDSMSPRTVLHQAVRTAIASMNGPLATRLQRTKSILLEQIVPENGSAGSTPHGVHVIIAVCGLRDAIQQICYKTVRYLTWKGHRTKLFSTRSASLPASPTSCQHHGSLRMALEAAMSYTDRGGIAVLDNCDVQEDDIDWMLENSTNIKLLWIVAGTPNLQLPSIVSSIYIRYEPEFSVKPRNIKGAVSNLVLRFVSHLRLKEIPIFISRHGESRDNLGGFLGGNSSITDRGEQFAVALGRFMDEKNLASLQVWTSSLQRAVATAAHIKTAVVRRNLDCLQEINAGDHTGLTYMEIKKRYPEEYDARKKDKLGYRYPNGESYIDIINRIDNVILEIEAADFPVLIVSHKAVLRCLLGYFLHTKRMDIPESPLPSHSVSELKYTPHGIIMDTYEMGIDHVENLADTSKSTIPKPVERQSIADVSKDQLSVETMRSEHDNPKLS